MKLSLSLLVFNSLFHSCMTVNTYSANALYPTVGNTFRVWSRRRSITSLPVLLPKQSYGFHSSRCLGTEPSIKIEIDPTFPIIRPVSCGAPEAVLRCMGRTVFRNLSALTHYPFTTRELGAKLTSGNGRLLVACVAVAMTVERFPPKLGSLLSHIDTFHLAAL